MLLLCTSSSSSGTATVPSSTSSSGGDGSSGGAASSARPTDTIKKNALKNLNQPTAAAAKQKVSVLFLSLFKPFPLDPYILVGYIFEPHAFMDKTYLVLSCRLHLLLCQREIMIIGYVLAHCPGYPAHLHLLLTL